MDIMALAEGRGLEFTGTGLIVLGILIRWWASRYDIKDAVLDSAWQAARGKRSAANPTEVEKRLKEITSQATAAGKVTTAASTVIGHFFAQAIGLVALIIMLAGAGMIGLGLWKG